MKPELPREIWPLQPINQLSPKMTMAIAAPPASSESATGGKMKVMASVTMVSETTPKKRESVVSWRRSVRIIRPFDRRLL